MTEGGSPISTGCVIDELTRFSTLRHFTAGTQAVFAAAAHLLRASHQLPVYSDRLAPGDYVVKNTGVEVQTSRPIVEGDTLTVYVKEGGKVYARLDAEFDERFDRKD